MINYKLIIKMLSFIILIVSIFILAMIPVALYYKESSSAMAFTQTFIIMIIASLLGILSSIKNEKKELSLKGGFLFVSFSWILVAGFGALPFIFSGSIPSYIDAYFETMSGLTTTGASIIKDIEALPKSILLWRATTHWMGGMGIVVLTVALLPLLGVDAFRLLKAEAPGPVADRLSSRITRTAKYLWGIYIGLSAIQIILLKIFGMSLFDSICHAFATMATGGFSTKNTSIGYYPSAAIQYTITIFMILAGANFSLYFRFLNGNFKIFSKDSEFTAYIFIIFISTILITVNLYATNFYSSIEESFRYASFQVASIITTTGFATTDYEKWGNFPKYILFILMFVGGCAGSTGGGMKVIRIITLFKQSLIEIRRMIYPKATFNVRINNKPIEISLIHNILGFVILYLLLIFLVSAIVSSGGHDIITSLTSSLATVGNIGPGFSLVGPIFNYSFFQDYIKCILSFAMLLGRLEIYTVLVIIFPIFWKVRAN